MPDVLFQIRDRVQESHRRVEYNRHVASLIFGEILDTIFVRSFPSGVVFLYHFFRLVTKTPCYEIEVFSSFGSDRNCALCN